MVSKRPTKKRKRKRKRKRTKKARKRASKKVSKEPNYKKSQCSPKEKGDYLDFSCYTPEVLFKMKNVWNQRHPDSKILTNDLKKIWEKLGYYMKNTCDKEACWIKDNLFKTAIEKDKAKNLFSPQAPESWKRNKNEWLSSLDIVHFMKQYESAYKCFEFIGPSPIDYDTQKAYGECVWEDLCKFDLRKEISNGKKKIAVIFNLDPHYKSGSHWVALFVDSNKKEIYYFDSYGDKCPTNIRKLAREIQNQSNLMGKKYKFLSNKKRHQFGNSECGVYCLYFIMQMLQDVKFSRFNKKINDIQMEKLRKKYFNI
tara:strand:- start:7 stop:942 length:936 start_codon:yes stop_codon:yes gene_type:complete